VTVLGIDTATAATAVALRLRDGDTREGRDDPTTRSASGALGAHPGHATRLLPLAAELLAAAGLSWAAVERIAVGVGPGTFTGLRVGIATARGLAQSLSCPLIGVSSLEALAAPALDEAGTVLAVIDARRGEVFAAAYDSASGLVAGPKALAPEAVGALADAGWLAVGDGAVRYRERIGAAGLQVPPQDSPLHVVRAAAVCAIAVARAPTPGIRVAPDYVRRPDAELALGGAEQA
jgi:tRNA threonylcarbamoyladenosine biosynthesis protein TsaB